MVVLFFISSLAISDRRNKDCNFDTDLFGRETLPRHFICPCRSTLILKTSNMGKLIVYNFITVNGYFKGRNEDISWAKQNNSEEENKLAAENAGSGNLLLFGRKTYEMMAAYWPSAEAIKNAPELAAGINNAEKIVFSKTLRNADWNNTRIIKENMEEEKQENSNRVVEDKYNLKRFLTAQEDVYSNALTELRSGRKRSHWMWFIFPQIDGLGHSSMAKHYSIKSLDEAEEYLKHTVLGQRLIECTQMVLQLEGRSASEIFGYPDDMKLKSSMTLFDQVSKEISVFSLVLEKYFEGKRDGKTLELIKYI